MTLVPKKNVFAPQSVDTHNPMTSHTGIEIANMTSQARRDGGWLAGWRVQRAASNNQVRLVEHALETFFEARREELSVRVALALDAAKKRAVAANMAETAMIEKHIVGMTVASLDELSKTALDVAKEAAFEETRRVRELEAALARGDITESRFRKACARIEQRTDDISDQAKAVADRVVENLGERLSAALRPG